MKQIVSSLILLAFSLMLEMVTFLSTETSETLQMLRIIVLFFIWGGYIIFSDKIDKAICSIRGKRYVNRNRHEILSRFYDDIMPGVIDVHNFTKQNKLMVDISDIYFQDAYHKWCKSIYFIKNYCCKKSMNVSGIKYEVDLKIVRSPTNENIDIYRFDYIDMQYIKSVLEVLKKFSDQYDQQLESVKDYSDYKNHLNDIYRILI